MRWIHEKQAFLDTRNEMVTDMPVMRNGRQREYGSLEPAARRRLTNEEIRWNAKMIRDDGGNSSNASSCNSSYSWICVGSRSSNASGCNSSYSWICVGSRSSNASDCNSSYSWICLGSHSSNASGWISVGSHSSNASGCNSPYSSVAMTLLLRELRQRRRRRVPLPARMG